MKTIVLAAAIVGATMTFTQGAEARSAYNGQRCVPTPSSKGKTILVCGSGQGGVYNPATCRKVYNSYTRRMETLC